MARKKLIAATVELFLNLGSLLVVLVVVVQLGIIVITGAIAIIGW